MLPQGTRENRIFTVARTGIYLDTTVVIRVGPGLSFAIPEHVSKDSFAIASTHGEPKGYSAFNSIIPLAGALSSCPKWIVECSY